MKRGIGTSCLDQCRGKGDAGRIACRRIRAATGWFDVEAQPWSGMEPAQRPLHRVAAIRSRAPLAGGPWCVAIRTLHGVAQGVGLHESIPRAMWAATPQQNGAIFAMAVGRKSYARPAARTGARSRQRRHWTAMRPNANVEFTVTTRPELDQLNQRSIR
jgi:hypothetical protein